MLTVRTPMRRFDPRVEVLVELAGELHRGHEIVPAALRDLSDHGMKLAVDRYLPVGERIRVTLQRPSPVALNAEVRWCRATDGDDKYHVGLLVHGDLSVLIELQRYVSDG